MPHDPTHASPAAPGVNRIFGLDALRAAAILGVLLAHGFGVLYPHVPYLGLLGHGGFYGVELFFVLSGFLIGRILIKAGPELGHAPALWTFYLRRWFRTLPLFWLFFLINVWLEWFLRQRHLTWSELAGHLFFLRTFAANRASFFGESWSLAVEEWFYLLFPLALWAGLSCWRRFDRVFLSTALAFYLFSTAARLASAGHGPASWAEWERKVVIDRFDALMAGVIAAWISVRFPGLWSRRPKAAATAGAVLLTAMYLTLWTVRDGQILNAPDTFFARTLRFNLVSLGFALLLPAASAWRLKTEGGAALATRKIALWSYALYLVHFPVMQIIQDRWFTGWNASAAQAAASFALQIAVPIALSAILFRVYESPLTRRRDKAAPAIVSFFRRPAR